MTESGKLAAALAAFQAEMPTVPKAKKAEVTMKSGGKYSYTYADLADVTDAAMPLLSKNGLAFTTCPRQTERGYELCGRLLHESGEVQEGALPIAGATPQEMGSSITYMRRYLLGCMTGIVTDDDDDGQIAQRGAPAKKATAKRASSPPPGEPPSAHNQPMTAGTRGAMFALFTAKGVAEEHQLAGVNHLTGKQYESRADITEADAKVVIGHLKKRPDVAEDGAA